MTDFYHQQKELERFEDQERKWAKKIMWDETPPTEKGENMVTTNPENPMDETKKEMSLEFRQRYGIASSSTSLAMPDMDLQTAVARFQALGQFVGQIMKEGVDYGKIPGTPKNTLLKPGAEKLCTFFGLTKEFEVIDKEEDWTGERHGGEPFFFYHYVVRLRRNGILIAEADGSANSWESKHRYRQAERACPLCQKDTIRKGRDDKGGGWYCWSKIGGCGATFKAGDKTIEGQDTGRRKNPDPADLVNTVQKMAYKRALVAVTLVAVNASEYFTQDIEDFVDITPPGPAEPEAPPKESLSKPTSLQERKEKAVAYLIHKGKDKAAGENYLKKSYSEWNDADLDALKAWIKSNFKEQTDNGN
uniref:Uncharacterized protein n=1 Tax=viral metagenome TaxID=1070528 RepID=A0A6H2A1P5_9ZZZZ